MPVHCSPWAETPSGWLLLSFLPPRELAPPLRAEPRRARGVPPPPPGASQSINIQRKPVAHLSPGPSGLSPLLQWEPHRIPIRGPSSPTIFYTCALWFLEAVS